MERAVGKGGMCSGTLECGVESVECKEWSEECKMKVWSVTCKL